MGRAFERIRLSSFQTIILGFSVLILIGALLLKFGLEQYEPRVSRSAWIRRFIMAILMIGAMSLYAFAKN